MSDGKDDLRAESLVREAIAAWEDILPKATDKDYRKFAVARLGTAYIRLGGLQRRLGKRSDSEASFKKAIDYGENAVALDPARAFAKHNLEVARRNLEGLREQAFEEEIDKLSRAERFADAIDLFRRSIKEQDERIRSGKDLDNGRAKPGLPTGSVCLAAGSLP